MSAHRDPDALVGAWLDDGPTELPEPTRRAIGIAIQSIPQRRDGLALPWRAAHMNGYLRLLLAGAALVAVVGVALVFIPRDSDEGGVGAPASAAPGSSPEAGTPSASDGAPLLLADAVVGPDGLAPGDYVIDRPFPVRIGLTLPSGWDVWAVGEDAAGILAWTADDHGSGWPLSFWIVDKVGDPCGTGEMKEVGPGVDDLAEALAGLTGYEVTEPEPVTVDGYAGVRLDISAPDGLGSCARQPLWSTATEPAACSIAEGERFQVRIVDVDGMRLVIGSADYPQTSAFEAQFVSPNPSAHADDLVEMRAIVDSITLDP